MREKELSHKKVQKIKRQKHITAATTTIIKFGKNKIQFNTH